VIVVDRDYTPYQRRVIRNHYRNRDAAREQRLAELVTEVYLATTPRKKDQLWERVRKLLEEEGIAPPEIERIVGSRDAEALAALVNK
jgi:hypothetical protein